MNKNNKNTEKNNIKSYIIAFVSIIAVILISVYLMGLFSPNKKVKVTENQISNTVNNSEENSKNTESQTQGKLKTTASESDYEKLSTDFINVISTLDGNGFIKPDYNNKEEFYKQSRIGQCNILRDYLSDNMAEKYNCEKLPNIANDPTYSSTLITSKIEEIKVKSKVKLDEETFRFTYYVKIKFDLEQLKNHGEGSDGGTIKATATEEFNDVYVDVKNNKIFKTNIDESMKNATVLWNGKSYLNLDWQVAK